MTAASHLGDPCVCPESSARIACQSVKAKAKKEVAKWTGKLLLGSVNLDGAEFEARPKGNILLRLPRRLDQRRPLFSDECNNDWLECGDESEEDTVRELLDLRGAEDRVVALLSGSGKGPTNKNLELPEFAFTGLGEGGVPRVEVILRLSKVDIRLEPVENAQRKAELIRELERRSTLAADQFGVLRVAQKRLACVRRARTVSRLSTVTLEIVGYRVWSSNDLTGFIGSVPPSTSGALLAGASAEQVREFKVSLEKCEARDATSCRDVARRFCLGDGPATNMPKALEFEAKACEFGDVETCRRAGERFSLSGNEVTDHLAQLAWSVRTGGDVTHGVAATACAEKGAGWRLPTWVELRSLFDEVVPRSPGSVAGPLAILAPKLFSDTSWKTYWSSSYRFDADGTEQLAGLSFSPGQALRTALYDVEGLRQDKAVFRCVKSVVSTPRRSDGGE